MWIVVHSSLGEGGGGELDHIVQMLSSDTGMTFVDDVGVRALVRNGRDCCGPTTNVVILLLW